MPWKARSLVGRNQARPCRDGFDILSLFLSNPPEAGWIQPTDFFRKTPTRWVGYNTAAVQ